MAVANLGGGDKLNIDTNTSVGLEKVIGKIALFIVKSQKATNSFLYGTGKKSDPKASKFQNAINKGLIKVLESLSDVDFCNILNYSLNSVKIGDNAFNPDKPPPPGSSQFEIRKWRLQKKAYDYQKLIDKYYGEYGTATGKDSKLGLANTIKAVNSAIDELSQELSDPEFTKTFPEITLFTNYLKNVKETIGQYSSLESVPVEEVQKAVQFVAKIRQILIGIQSLNTPANLIGSIDSALGGQIQEQLKAINEIIDAPDRLIPRLKDLIKLVNNIISVATTILRYISLAKTIVTISIILIRVFNVIKSFLLSNPLPSLYTTLGITVKVNKTYKEILSEQGDKKLIKRLSQINLVLTLMVIFVTSLLAGMNRILVILKAILLNLQSCGNADEDLQVQLAATITNLQNAITPLQRFIDQANSAQENANRTFGGYTIEIIAEQLTDENISIKRRYGIARNSNNVVVVQSTPTFASLDLIIINEVKALLVAKGLVKPVAPDISIEDQMVIMEASRFLDDDSNVSTDNLLGAIEVDSGENDLKEFTDNLPGGRAFRIKTRKRLIRDNIKLADKLKSSDPNGKYSQSLVKQKEQENTKLKIKNLEDERKGLQTKLIAVLVTPGGQALAIPIKKRMNEIDEEIANLKRG